MRLTIVAAMILLATGCGNAALEERVTDLEYEIYHLRNRVEALESRTGY